MVEQAGPHAKDFHSTSEERKEVQHVW
jgi:hypothetical protein